MKVVVMDNNLIPLAVYMNSKRINYFKMRIITIFFYLSFLKLSAQDISKGKIEYIVKAIDTTTLNIKEKDALEAQRYLNDLSKGIKDKIILTEFKGNESLSYEKKSMKLDSDRWSTFQSSLLGAKGNFYYNASTKELFNEVDALGEKFIVQKKPSTLNWTLLNEEKRVGKYKCYKAVRADTTMSLKKNIIKKYIAWYTPEIPISYGPLEHVGLPGLILEINVLGGSLPFTLFAREIIINSTADIRITKPNKGREISESEYDTLKRIALIEILEKSKRN